ncbi:MAG TPA: OmpH family outer membrane protein [Geobacteraceae bacterium]
MKYSTIPLVSLLILSFAATAFAAEGLKIASIDLTKIAQESKAGEKAKQSLEKFTETLGKNLKKKEAELDKLKAALEGKGKPLSAGQRSVKEKEFRKKFEAYRQSAQNAQKELQAKEEEFLDKLMAEIKKTVKEYAPKNGYALVLRKGDLIYSDEKNQTTDITDDVLKVLNGAQEEAAPKQDGTKK